MKHLLSLKDLTKEEINNIIKLAEKLRIYKKEGKVLNTLYRKNLIMIFEKSSLRTRTTFEIAMNDLGGHAINMDVNMIKLGERESIKDAALNFSRWADAVMIRTFGQERIEEFAKYSSIPVINALTDRYHPCQALAFYEAIVMNNKLKDDFKLVFVGDGNNVANSLFLLSSFFNWQFVHIVPKGYEIKEDIIKEALGINPNFRYEITDDIKKVKGADAIYTDVWASMGQEKEKEIRKRIFSPYQVNMKVVEMAENPDVVVSHCLPAHRGEEITDDVLDSEFSIAFDEAECRLHAQKAVLIYLINGNFNVE